MAASRRLITSEAALSSRLAARYHQRQARLQRATRAMAVRISRLYSRLAGILSRRAARSGLPGLIAMDAALDRELDSIHDALRDDLRRSAMLGYRTAVDAILQAVPADWLAMLAGMAASHKEGLAEAVPSDSPRKWELGPEIDPASRGALNRDEAMRLIAATLFAAPTEDDIDQWLTVAVPGGLSWEDRLRRWEKPARAAMLSELSIGLSAGENVDDLRSRIKPFADGVAWKAQRIARTEGNRAAERANRATIDGMGGMVDGMQIVAVMDEWTRPEHAARNGRIYTRRDDGIFRDSNGDPLPDLPDAPNCRCMTIPVLKPPEDFRKNQKLAAVFKSATGELIPDPSSYMDWWERASVQERKIAVGARRYRLLIDRLGRSPEWPDFIDTDGSLLSTEQLRRESVSERKRRKARVLSMLQARQRAFQAVVSQGLML